VARKIKERYGSNRGPLLIGISGQYKQAVDKILSDIIGFDHYVTKPYEPSDVLRFTRPCDTRQNCATNDDHQFGGDLPLKLLRLIGNPGRT
jgi:DNA-binding response OmpR family regulator